MAIKFTVNGKPQEVDVDPETPLLWLLRDELKLTGTKFGCGAALCGACTVHLDGEAVRSCQIPAQDAADREVTTIEGVTASQEKIAKAVQDAWIELDVAQCGYCQPGQVMSAVGLLTMVPNPTDEEIDQAMGGNICRCCTYYRIRKAIHQAAKAI